MIFLNESDYSKFKYTKIQVPIELRESPSDFEDSSYYLDIDCDSIYQKDCYIGKLHIDELSLNRIRNSIYKEKILSPKWNLEFVIAGVKKEDEVILILDELCDILTLACVKEHNYIQHSGLYGFSYHSMEIKRSYATEDRVFGDIVVNSRGIGLEVSTCNTLKEEVFILPKAINEQTMLLEKLENALLAAMRSNDAVARYILLYYMFEIMCGTKEYQYLKQQYEENTKEKKKIEPNQKRSELLFQYLRQEFHLTEYQSFSEKLPITTEILYEIIQTRNDLTHRADTSKINKIMYHHMLPILRCILNSAT